MTMQWQPLESVPAGVQGRLLGEWNKVINNIQFLYTRYVNTGPMLRLFNRNEVAVGQADGTIDGLELGPGSILVGTATGVAELEAGDTGDVLTVGSDNTLAWSPHAPVSRWRILVGV